MRSKNLVQIKPLTISCTFLGKKLEKAHEEAQICNTILLISCKKILAVKSHLKCAKKQYCRFYNLLCKPNARIRQYYKQCILLITICGLIRAASLPL